MEAIFMFYFENLGEAEIFEETAKTYPQIANHAVIATHELGNGYCADVVVHVYKDQYEYVTDVLESLSKLHTKGPATGRYEWK